MAKKNSKTSKTAKASRNVPDPIVGIAMGSKSDWDTMQEAANVLEGFGVPYEAVVVSAHRTPMRMVSYATSAAQRGIQVIIAGAGGAAHLPGMMASLTHLPVLGVPVQSKALSGLDSLLSIAQMPAGVPVGSLAVGKAGATNAALLAISILSLQYPTLSEAYREWRSVQTASVAMKPYDEKKSKKQVKAKKKK